MIEKTVTRPAVYTELETAESSSPFGANTDWTMDTGKMEALGVQRPKHEARLPSVIEEFAKSVARK